MADNFFDKNMAAVKEAFPDFHQWILDQPDIDWLRQEGENQLHVTIGVVSQPMYDVDDPLRESDNIDGMPLHKENVSVFVGLGLGHVASRVCEKMEKGHHVVVVEPVGHVYRLAFARHDFSEAIRTRSLLFAPGRAEVDAVLGFLESAKVVTDWLVFVDKTCSRRYEYFKVTEHALEVLNQIQCNTGTIVSAGAKIADNDVATLPWVIRHRGVAELVGLFAGKPAVVVSTGPSLERNIHVLRDCQDKVVIVAVGQALRPLLAYDIRPDFICTVDFGEVNMTHYAGLCDEDVPLVTINKTYAPLLKAYRGPKLISAGAVSVETTHSLLKNMGELPQGGSVAHMAFGLAVNLGCSPVMLVGQDLALGDASHFGQADSMGRVWVDENNMIKWKIDDPRSATLHGRDDIGMGPAQHVPGWWGRPVLTNTGLMTFITAMQRLVEQCPVPVINCTEGGCHLDGTRRMFLADAVAEHCQHRIDKTVLSPLLGLHPDADKRIAAAMPLLDKDMRTLDIIVESAEKGLATVMKARNTANTKKLRKILFDNMRYSETANEGARRMPPVGLAIFAASRRIQSRELNVEKDLEHLLKNRKDLATRLERNEVILTAARDAAKELRKSYLECRLLLAGYAKDKTILDPTGETQPASVADADHYIAAGNFAKPLLEARRIMADEDASELNKEIAWETAQRCYKLRDDRMRAAKERQTTDYAEKNNLVPQYLDLIDDSRRLGRDDKNMGPALDAIKKAVALLPDREEARWGLASALLHLNRIDEALAAYDDLCRRFPDNLRYRFERGQAMLLANRVSEGLAEVRDVMSRSGEFDQFLLPFAGVLLENGRREEALKAVTLYLARFPQDVKALEMLKALNSEG